LHGAGKNRKTAQSYADSSTKNAIEHLKTIHRIDADGEMEPLEDQLHSIRAAFGRTLPKVFFNVVFFKVVLVRWVISCNIPFRGVEHPAFRLLVGYLAACVRLVSLLMPKAKQF
jgi:hypothetical protein